MAWLRVPEMVIQTLVTPEDISATPRSDILTVLEIRGHEPVSQTGRKAHEKREFLSGQARTGLVGVLLRSQKKPDRPAPSSGSDAGSGTVSVSPDMRGCFKV